MQALGLNGEEYDDSRPPITGAQLSERIMGDALTLVPEAAADRYVRLVTYANHLQ